jgi:hypothetical protein
VSTFDAWFARLRVALGEPLVKSLRRRLRAAAPSALSELREGLHCRITGTVGALDSTTLQAPLQGVPCVAYMLEIIETTRYSRDLVGYDKQAVPFVLVEDDHRARIDPAHLELLVTPYELISTSDFRTDPRQRALLERYCPRRDWYQTTELAFREVVVGIGERVTIAGTGHRELDPHAQNERGFRDEARQRLRLVGSAQLPILIGDALA